MNAVEYESIQIEKTKKVCPLCEDYAKRQASKPVVVMSCEGGCLRGEVARRAANVLFFELAPEKTLFGIDEMPESELNAHSREVARAIAAARL